MTLQTYAAFQTNQRIQANETIAWCTEMRKGTEYCGPYRPDPALRKIADDALHALMGYRAEHSDPLAF